VRYQADVYGQVTIVLLEKLICCGVGAIRIEEGSVDNGI